MFHVVPGTLLIQFNTDLVAILPLLRDSDRRGHCGNWVGHQYDPHPLLVQREERTPHRHHLGGNWVWNTAVCSHGSISSLTELDGVSPTESWPRVVPGVIALMAILLLGKHLHFLPPDWRNKKSNLQKRCELLAVQSRIGP